MDKLSRSRLQPGKQNDSGRGGDRHRRVNREADLAMLRRLIVSVGVGNLHRCSKRQQSDACDRSPAYPPGLRRPAPVPFAGLKTCI